MLPLPPHEGHVCADVPGAAPVPPHKVHCVSRGTFTIVSPPFIERSKGIFMRTVTSSPFCGAAALLLWLPPLRGPFSKNMSKISENPPDFPPPNISPNIDEKSIFP
ncbi:MAG: hypothetical protein BWY84_01193 [Candidatus Aerophobetes bacterium ADurb.Bin490]|nr:MAG: hypothetical protein BWY84_01193 [Candidatus Aerophobetes bacterium ADurb.Bin490]